MYDAYVVMTALPPTKGHKRLIDFAKGVTDSTGGVAVVIVCTQPNEPMAYERYVALRNAFVGSGVVIDWLNEEMEQDPESNGFWDMWRETMQSFGAGEGDFVVASEHYGQRLADEVGATFMPYDIKRDLYWSRATDIRRDPLVYFDKILPEFQPYLRKTVTMFGAESTGKSTLTRHLSSYSLVQGHYCFEYARPYLEEVGAELSTAKMTSIWYGQRALQQQAKEWLDRPYIFQDTDLFSTVGYWRMYESKFGPVPASLIDDAKALKSDLYVITPSNIDFEADQLRYGGAVRESTDQYWVNLCEEFDLPYMVLTSSNLCDRIDAVAQAPVLNANPLAFQRQYN